jgi:hypothetical protein
LAGSKRKALAATQPLTPKALRRDLKRLDRDLARARSRRDQAQARLEALEVLGAQLAADLDAAVAAAAWIAEGTAVAEAVVAVAEAVDETGTPEPAEHQTPDSADLATPSADTDPVPIATSLPRRRRTPPAPPPAESA